MKYSVKKILGLCGLTMAISTCFYAQISDVETRISTNLVLIDVLVVDKSGNAVRGLRADQFELFTDNIKQSIESFSAEKAPVSFGIVYDMHPTTSDRNKAVIESLRDFQKELGPEDDIFFIAFDMRGQQNFDFVPTVEQLDRHMAEPDHREPRSLYDAVYIGSDKMQSSRNQKRVLLIISDSADHRSKHAFGDVQRRLAAINTEVYAIVVDDHNNLGYKDLTQKGRDVYPFSTDASPVERAALLDLTLKTGGSTYFGGSASTIRLQEIYQAIAAEMRSHYTLGFYPDVIDAKPHSIKVKLRGVAKAKGLVLGYRMYYQNLRSADK